MTTKARIIDRANIKGAVPATSKGRFAFEGIAFTPDGTVSTDGKILLQVPYADHDEQDFPIIPNMPEPDPDLGLDETTVVPMTAITKIEKNLPTKPTRPILGCARIVRSSPDHVTAGVTDLETSSTMEARLLEGKFPNVKQVFPDGDPIAETEVDIDLMIRLLKAAKEVAKVRGFGERSAPTIKLFLREDHSGGGRRPVEIELPGPNGPNARGIIMPILKRAH